MGHIVPPSKLQHGSDGTAASGDNVGGKGAKSPGNVWSYLVQNLLPHTAKAEKKLKIFKKKICLVRR
jgi:hypothetical protein